MGGGCGLQCEQVPLADGPPLSETSARALRSMLALHAGCLAQSEDAAKGLDRGSFECNASCGPGCWGRARRHTRPAGAGYTGALLGCNFKPCVASRPHAAASAHFTSYKVHQPCLQAVSVPRSKRESSSVLAWAWYSNGLPTMFSTPAPAAWLSCLSKRWYRPARASAVRLWHCLHGWDWERQIHSRGSERQRRCWTAAVEPGTRGGEAAKGGCGRRRQRVPVMNTGALAAVASLAICCTASSLKCSCIMHKAR